MICRASVVFGLVTAACVGAETLFDKYCLVTDPVARYPVPEVGEAVVGMQKTWFTTPYDLKPGLFSMNCSGLQEVTGTSFVVTPRSVVGSTTYRFTHMQEEPPGENALHARKLIALGDVRFDQLPEVAERNILITCRVLRVFPEGKGFECVVPLASGELPFLVDVVTMEDMPRLPQVHSRQYGPHAQHTFDIYYPEGFRPGIDEPLPMYVMIHGGGWGALDKMNNKIGDSATSYNAMGIAFVSVNYRYVSAYDQPPAMTVPVAAPLLDAARCMQHIRFHASDLGVDPDRVCLTGGSAGGATSAWLAMVDDLADPVSPDPIARMSTRVTASTPHQAQTCLDPRLMREWIPSINYGAHAFVPGNELPKNKAERFDLWLSKRDETMPYILDFSAYHQASADDPPMLLVYGGQDDIIPAKDGGNATHHPKFGEHLCKRLTALGVECDYWAGTRYGREGWVHARHRRYEGWSGVRHFVADRLGVSVPEGER